MIIDKAFKLLRKVQNNFNSGDQIRGSYVPNKNSIPPTPHLNKLKQRLSDHDFMSGFTAKDVLDHNFKDDYHEIINTPGLDLFDKARKRKLGVGISEDHVIEVLHTTTTGTGPKFHMPDENTLIIEASHSVDIEQEKLTNVEDLGRTHRYYGKGKTVINFIKEPKEWPEHPVDEFGEEININELATQCNRGSCIKEQHSNVFKPIEWPNKPQIHKDSALKVEKNKQQKLRNKLTISTEEYERMLECINKEN